MSRERTQNNYRLVWQLFWEEKVAYTLMGLLVLGTTSLTILVPLVSKQLIDGIVSGQRSALKWVAATVVLSLGQLVLGRAMALLMTKVSYRTIAHLKNKAYAAAIGSPLQGPDSVEAGELFTIIMTDSDQVVSFMRQTLPSLLGRLSSIIGTSIAMTYLDPSLFVVVLGMIPLQFALLRYRAVKIGVLSHSSRKASGELASTLVRANLNSDQNGPM